MLSSTPVMYEASSEARKITPLATSSDSPRRFIGTCWAKPSTNSLAASAELTFLPKMGVKIGPGATALTRIFRPSSSAASVRVSERSAALPLWCTDPVEEDLRQGNPVLRVLNHYCGVQRHGIALDKFVTVILSQSDEEQRPMCGIYFNLHSPYQKSALPKTVNEVKVKS